MQSGSALAKCLAVAFGVDRLVVQITPAAGKAVQLWSLIPTRIRPCSNVLFPSTLLTSGFACACVVDTSLLVAVIQAVVSLMERLQELGILKNLPIFCSAELTCLSAHIRSVSIAFSEQLFIPLFSTVLLS